MGEERKTQSQGMRWPQTIFLHVFSNQMEGGNCGNLETERCWQMQKSLNVCSCCTVQVFTGALEQLLVDSELLLMFRVWKPKTRVSSQDPPNLYRHKVPLLFCKSKCYKRHL